MHQRTITSVQKRVVASSAAQTKIFQQISSEREPDERLLDRLL